LNKAPDIQIQAGTPDDIPEMMALERQTPTSAHWSESRYREMFSTQGSARLVLVARSAAISGFLIAQNIPPEWELENIVVAEGLRRSGLGTRLLEALIQGARNTNSTVVFLEVRESNSAARLFYERAGFGQTGRRKSYYQNPLEDAVGYRLDLS
jgi:[ribosomal protein S18]-alanine N-acetyltransferase